MQLQSWHMAASSSPMYGGGPRWGINDLALKMLKWSTLSPIPAFPRKRGKETLPHAALILAYGSIFLPHVWGRIEVGGKRPRTYGERGGGQTTSSARWPPSRPSPAKRGKETLPHAATVLAYGSIFLPHVWGRTEVGDKRLPTEEDRGGGRRQTISYQPPRRSRCRRYTEKLRYLLHR